MHTVVWWDFDEIWVSVLGGSNVVQPDNEPKTRVMSDIRLLGVDVSAMPSQACAAAE